MNMYKFHKDENKVKEVLRKELYDNSLILESLRSNFIICADFNSLDIQRELFNMMGLDKKYNTLDQVWREYDKKYGNGQDEFETFDEFADAVRYVDLATQRAICQGFGHNIAIAIKNGKFTQENFLKTKCLHEEKYLRQLETEGDDIAFDEFCLALGIEYEKMTDEQIGLIKKFFNNTMLYAEKLVKKEEVEFIKRYLPFISKIEGKLESRFFTSAQTLNDLILKVNPQAKGYKIYDELTDKTYLVIDISGQVEVDSEKELFEMSKQKDSPVVFIGGLSDKINTISGKTMLSNDNPSYAIDINLANQELQAFYLSFLDLFLRETNFNDYKGYVNDMMEWGPLFVGFSDFNKYVNLDLMEKMDKDKISTKIGILLKNPKKLENFLQKLAKNYRKNIDDMYQKTIVETKKYSSIVTKYKPEEIIPFAEF